MNDVQMMLRLVILFLLILSGPPLPSEAQTILAENRPIANRISIETIDRGRVALLGAADSVPTGEVAVRNLYTGETIVVTVATDGSFRAEIGGSPQMAFQIQAASRFPDEQADRLAGVGIIWQAERRDDTIAMGGRASYGAATWVAEGRINQTQFMRGEALDLQLGVLMTVPDADLTLDYLMSGQLSLRRVLDEVGQPVSGGDNGVWSSQLTGVGLPIAGTALPERTVAIAVTDAVRVDAEQGTLQFTLSFEAQLPDDLEAGWYVPIVQGGVSVGDSQAVDWYANRIFSVAGTERAGSSATTLPLLLNLGDAPAPRLLLSLFDSLADDDTTRVGLLGTWQHMPPLPIRSPASYTIQPTILNHENLVVPQLQDAELNVTITQPDGRVVRLGTSSVVPIVTEDGIQLTPLNANFEHDFNVYGDYQIELTATALDAQGRTHSGGGVYTLTIAEPLTLHPAILPGTPLLVGERFDGVLRLSPAPPQSHFARIEVAVRHSAGSDAIAEDGTILKTGEYRADYQARFTDATGQLWVGSLRGAGVVVAPDAIASGRGGLADYEGLQQAWFDTERFPDDAFEIAPVVNFPRYSGDVARLPDEAEVGINPALSVEGYHYLTIGRSDGTLRQIIQSADSALRFDLYNDEPNAARIGWGNEGNRLGDIMWLFGGAVVQDSTSGYAATALLTADDTVSVAPPFAQGNEWQIHVTQLHAGAIVTADTPPALTGYLAPALPATITAQINGPSGRFILQGQANPFGYFALPVEALAAGIYRVQISVTYDGMVSSGLLPGAVVGTLPEYTFVVVNAEAEPLATERGPISELLPAQPFSVNASAPAGWTDVEGVYTAHAAGQILDQGVLDIINGRGSYTFDWAAVAREFPNLETRNITTAADVDQVTFTVVLEGRLDNRRVVGARSFTLRGRQLITLDGTN